MWPHPHLASSSSSSSAIHTTSRAKTMDEVWKDIALASDGLPHHHRRTPSGIILQDFFSKDPTSTTSTPPPPPPPPPTLLTLTSNRLLISPVPVVNHPDSGTKRFLDCDRAASGCDQRQKRMIKNRESAARSRARKQAYTNELELEVEHLLEENARLREEQRELDRAAAAQNEKKKGVLNRASTAPF